MGSRCSPATGPISDPATRQNWPVRRRPATPNTARWRKALADLHAAWTTEHDSRRELVSAEELLGTVTELIAVRRAHKRILPAARQHRDDAWMAADAAMARAQRVEAVVTEYADTLAAALARDW